MTKELDGLPTYLQNALRSAAFDDGVKGSLVQWLTQMTNAEFLRLPNLGVSSMSTIKTWMAARGLFMESDHVLRSVAKSSSPWLEYGDLHLSIGVSEFHDPDITVWVYSDQIAGLPEGGMTSDLLGPMPLLKFLCDTVDRLARDEPWAVAGMVDTLSKALDYASRANYTRDLSMYGAVAHA